MQEKVLDKFYDPKLIDCNQSLFLGNRFFINLIFVAAFFHEEYLRQEVKHKPAQLNIE